MTKKLTLICITALIGMLFILGCDERTEPLTQETIMADKQVAILITEGFHDQETLHPRDFLTERGVATTIIGPEVKTVTAYNSDTQVQIESAIGDVTVNQFDALVIPGGHSPSNLREDEAVVEFVRSFVDTGKPVAAICHGPQVLIAAGVMEGKRATCFSGMSEELIEAGADYEDTELVRDGNIITSRVPGDLPVFSQAIADALLE